MNADPRIPTLFQTVTAIAWREITMAMRRRLVKLLFIANLIPPLVMAIVLVVMTVAKGVGLENLDWDPLVRLLQIQLGPVLLLAFGIGTPLVARDRSEDVLFLYATRPVTPWSYTVGKMLAVVVPAVALVVLPGILLGILRAGLMAEFDVLDAVVLNLKLILVALLLAVGFAGVTVGPSAATKKTRWAILLAFGCLTIPELISQLIWHDAAYALDVANAGDHLVSALFDNDDITYGIVAAITMVVWGVLGALVTSARVRKEMIP